MIISSGLRSYYRTKFTLDSEGYLDAKERGETPASSGTVPGGGKFLLPYYLLIGGFAFRIIGLFTSQVIPLVLVIWLYATISCLAIFLGTFFFVIAPLYAKVLAWWERCIALLINLGISLAHAVICIYIFLVGVNVMAVLDPGLAIEGGNEGKNLYPFDPTTRATIEGQLATLAWPSSGTEVGSFGRDVKKDTILIVDRSKTSLLYYGSIHPKRRPKSLSEARYVVSVSRTVSDRPVAQQVKTFGRPGEERELSRANLFATVYTVQVLDRRSASLTYKEMWQAPAVALGEYFGPGPDWLEEKILPREFGVRVKRVLVPPWRPERQLVEIPRLIWEEMEKEKRYHPSSL